MADTKWSQFPSASDAYADDEVVGLKNGQNSRFSFAKILALIRQNLSGFFVPTSQKGVANGVASLDSTGKVPSAQLPPIASTATDVTYDNTQSGLTAEDVQEAIDELAQGGGGGGGSAANVTYDPTTSGLTATNVQEAIDEVVDDLDGKQDTLTIDTTPTANSTNPVQSGGVYTDVRTRVPVYGLGKNILDNAYFIGGGSQLGYGIFPINQRGQTVYSGNSTSFDRWRVENSRGQAIEIINNGIKITGTSSAYQGIQQNLENPSQYNGKTVAISCLFSDGQLLWTYGVVSLGSSDDIIMYDGEGSSGNPILFLFGSTSGLSFRVRCNKNLTKTVVAAKLEYGTEQTLCHNEGTDANPVWVLNEVPNYGEELLKCYRYLVIMKNITGTWYKIGVAVSYNTNIAMGFVPLPVTMRSSNLSVTYNGLILQNETQRISITGLSEIGIGQTSIYIQCSPQSSLTLGAAYLIGADSWNNAWLSISCEL